MGIINSWMITEVTGVATVTQEDGCSDKRREPGAEPAAPGNIATQIAGEPTKHT